jgi:DNA integrity scanning protein DisA with diadenylate cyclase activity
LYIAITNKISIADMKNNYARIQTIAHECIHSCQDRLLLMFNFIFSNIKLIYFLTITVLTILKIINNYYIQFAIFTLFTLIEFSIRSFLEIDAMTKAKFLAKEYMQNKNFCTKEEIEKVIKQYEKINKIGIPFVIDNLLTNEIMMILIYNIICIIMKII